MAPSTRVQWHAGAHRPGSEGSVFLLETERKQGWPVELGRWDITKHWIWPYGLVSAARVGDAGDDSIIISDSVEAAREPVATAARKRLVAVASSWRQTRHARKRSQAAAAQAVWQTRCCYGRTCRSRGQASRTGLWPGAVECGVPPRWCGSDTAGARRDARRQRLRDSGMDGVRDWTGH